MPLPKQKTYTIEDIYALADGERAELIDGQIFIWRHRQGHTNESCYH